MDLRSCDLVAGLMAIFARAEFQNSLESCRENMLLLSPYSPKYQSASFVAEARAETRPAANPKNNAHHLASSSRRTASASSASASASRRLCDRQGGGLRAEGGTRYIKGRTFSSLELAAVMGDYHRQRDEGDGDVPPGKVASDTGGGGGGHGHGHGGGWRARLFQHQHQHGGQQGGQGGSGPGRPPSPSQAGGHGHRRSLSVGQGLASLSLGRMRSGGTPSRGARKGYDPPKVAPGSTPSSPAAVAEAGEMGGGGGTPQVSNASTTVVVSPTLELAPLRAGAPCGPPPPPLSPRDGPSSPVVASPPAARRAYNRDDSLAFSGSSLDGSRSGEGSSSPVRRLRASLSKRPFAHGGSRSSDAAEASRVDSVANDVLTGGGGGGAGSAAGADDDDVEAGSAAAPPRTGGGGPAHPRVPRRVGGSASDSVSLLADNASTASDRDRNSTRARRGASPRLSVVGELGARELSHFGQHRHGSANANRSMRKSGRRKSKKSKSEKKDDEEKLGTYAGVFLPCLAQIVGVIFFLRLPTITGQAGTVGATLIVLACVGSTFLTSLSLGAIASNGTIQAGGPYYIISRTLGVEIGGALGVLFYLGTTLGASMHVMGAVETAIHRRKHAYKSAAGGLVLSFIDACPTQAWSLLLMLVIARIVSVGSKQVTQAANFFLAVVGLSIVSILVGTVLFAFGVYDGSLGEEDRAFGDNLAPNYRPDPKTGVTPTFWGLVAIFYPATTGIMAGTNRSSNLATPNQSIPIGTIGAIGVTTVLYILQVWLLGSVVSNEVLIYNKLVLTTVAFPSRIVAKLGMVTSCVGAALQCMAGAPQLLSAIAADDAIPFLKFLTKRKRPSSRHSRSRAESAPSPYGEGPGSDGSLLGLESLGETSTIVDHKGGGEKGGEGASAMSEESVDVEMENSKRAVWFTWAIASLGTLLGNIDHITPILTMFYLMMYGGINLCCFLLAWVDSPGFRPQ
ncbi:hypothetical protein ACHAWF_018171 [Thalassiosira exigua]